MADTMQTPMTTDQRQTFMFAMGQTCAFQGVQFCTFPPVDVAFKKASKSHFYRGLNFSDADFPSFNAGFQSVKDQMADVWKMKADAHAVVKQTLVDCGYESQSYVYDKDKPSPYLYDQPCVKCDADFDTCKCQYFKPTKNPAYPWDDM